MNIVVSKNIVTNVLIKLYLILDDIEQSKRYSLDYHENNGEYYMLMINTFPLCPGIFGAIGGCNPLNIKRYCYACPFSVSYNLQFSHLFNLQKRTGVCKCEVFFTYSEFVQHVRDCPDKAHQCLAAFLEIFDTARRKGSTRF